MFKDPKVILSLIVFGLFTIVWGILSLVFHIDEKSQFVAYIAQIAMAAWNILLLMIKPDGGVDKPKDAPQVQQVETEEVPK